MGRILGIDIETYSDVDLLKCGVYAYADSPAFEVLLFAYSFDDEETQVIWRRESGFRQRWSLPFLMKKLQRQLLMPTLNGFV